MTIIKMIEIREASKSQAAEIASLIMTAIKMIEIREASKSQAAEIASLIMTAMTDDCCLYFCGEGCGWHLRQL